MQAMLSLMREVPVEDHGQRYRYGQGLKVIHARWPLERPPVDQPDPRRPPLAHGDDPPVWVFTLPVGGFEWTDFSEAPPLAVGGSGGESDGDGSGASESDGDGSDVDVNAYLA